MNCWCGVIHHTTYGTCKWVFSPADQQMTSFESVLKDIDHSTGIAKCLDVVSRLDYLHEDQVSTVTSRVRVRLIPNRHLEMRPGDIVQGTTVYYNIICTCMYCIYTVYVPYNDNIYNLYFVSRSKKLPEIEQSNFILCSGQLKNKNGSVSHHTVCVCVCVCVQYSSI